MHIKNATIAPFLWFDGQAKQAVEYYTSIFPNSKIIFLNEAPGLGNTVATFELCGQRFMALDGGPMYKFNPAISLFVTVETQAEIDELWDSWLANGGTPVQCGWLKDQFGLSWQVVPTALSRHLSNPDQAAAKRAMQAMLKMTKIIIADLEAAVADE